MKHTDRTPQPMVESDTADRRTDIERLHGEIQWLRYELQNQQILYWTLAESVNETVCTVSPQGIITSLNSAFETTTAKSKLDWIGRDFLSLFWPSEASVIAERLQASLNGIPHVSIETRMSAQDGQPISVALTLRPQIEENTTIGVLAVIHDSTQHQQIEKRLLAREHALRERVKELGCLYTISAIVETPNLTLDEVLYRIVCAIPPAWHYPEITAARIQLLGKTYPTENFTVTPWIQSSTIRFREQAIGTIETVYLEERPEAGEGPFLLEERTLLDSIAGRLARLIERHEAHQKLRESETRYRTLIENIPIAVCRSTIGPNSRILMANTAMARMFGYDSIEELLQLDPRQLYQSPQQRDDLFQRMRREKNFIREELDMRKKDGTPVRVVFTASLIQDDTGTNLYADSLLEDVTEKRRAEEENQILEEQLQNSVTDGIVTIDDQLSVLTINEAALQLLDCQSENAKGANLQDICAGNLAPIAETAVRSLEKGEFIKNFQITIVQQGLESMYSLSVTPLRTGARKRGIIIIRDITRLYDLERQVSGMFPSVNMIGKSPAISEIFDIIMDVADTNTTILIEGESGTGKELVASAIHHQSLRRSGPFVRVNCVALSETLLESELFGHVRGAFTGANRDKPGRFEMAHGGTIFLDEIGDISPKMQQQLLRVLQEREIERVGSNRTIKVDVRVIAATNRNLAEMVDRGEFREDLYYRLNVVKICVPPLRERKEDIPLLVNHFLRHIQKRTGRTIKGFLPETMKTFMGYDWPGNIRQLENALERAVVMCRKDGFISPRDLPPEIIDWTPGKESEKKDVDTLNAERIREVLNSTGWNRSLAAKQLAISRSTLWRMMQKFNISPAIK